DTIDSNTSFTGGGANNCTGLWVQVENSGGGRVRIRYGSGSILMDTDETMPDYKGNSNYWDAILQKSFRLDMQATDVKDESGKVTAVKVMVWLNNVSMTGEDGFEIQNDGSHDEAFKSGWLSLHAGSNTDWMKADAYIHSIYLNTPDYPENLLLSGWRTTNSSGGVSMVIDETGIPYANDNNADTDNTYEEWTRSYMDYGCYEGEKVKDQKIRITAKAAFTSGDDFCVYFRGNNYSGNGWRWIRRGFFLSFSADNGVRICFGEAAFSYGGETRVYTTYDNDLIKGIYGKTLSELFAEGVTLEMQATDVKDESGNVTAVNIKIWINGKLIDNNGYDATEFTDYSMDGTVGADIFKEGYLILGGKITDSEGYISGVYLEEV
ncbi:MAG: hypothetical protein ACI4RO_05735, partial [Candidatus Scatosoma sp.]